MVLRRFVSLLPPFERIRDRSATGAAYIIEGHDPWMEVSDAENGCWGGDQGGRDEVHLGRAPHPRQSLQVDTTRCTPKAKPRPKYERQGVFN